MSYTVSLSLLGVVLLAAMVLQRVLSAHSKFWPGLVLPGLFTLGAVVVVLRLAFSYDAPAGQLAVVTLLTLLLANIPTLVLLGIYGWVRRKKRPPGAENADKTEDADAGKP